MYIKKYILALNNNKNRIKTKTLKKNKKILIRQKKINILDILHIYERSNLQHDIYIYIYICLNF